MSFCARILKNDVNAVREVHFLHAIFITNVTLCTTAGVACD